MPAGNSSHVAFDSQGRWLVTGSPIQYRFWEIRFWEIGSWTRTRSITRAVVGLPGAMAFSDDGQVLAMTEYQGRVRLLNAANGQELASVEACSRADDRASGTPTLSGR